MPPWPLTSSAAITRPRPVPPCAHAAAERLEQVVPRLLRQPRAGVAHPDLAAPGGLDGGDRDRSRARPTASIACAALRTRFDSTRKSWSGVGPHPQPGRDLRGEGDAAAGTACRSFSSTSATSGASRKTVGSGGSSSALPKVERPLAEVDRARQRADQLRRRPPHRRVGARLDPVGDELRRRQQVAQVVADLGHRAAEPRQPLLLPERRGQPHLEVVERRLRLAQLARAALRRDDPARVLRIVAVGRHMLDHPPDRPHDQPLHREKEQRRRRQRDRQRDVEDPQPVRDQRLAQRPLVQRHLDLALARPGVVWPITRMIRSWSARNTRERVAHQRELAGFAQIEGRRSTIAGICARQHQLAHVVAPQHHVQHVRGRQQLLLAASGDTSSSAGRELRQRRDLRQLEPVLQVVVAEARHRRHEEQHLGDHHEDDRQAQEPPGKGVEQR